MKWKWQYCHSEPGNDSVTAFLETRIEDKIKYLYIDAAYFKVREMILNMHTDNGDITLPGTPFKLSDTPETLRSV